MKELEGLYAEFMGRTPPAQPLAARCRLCQAFWLSFAGRTNQAEAAIVEAHELLLHAAAPASLRIPVATTYVSLMGRANPARAEQVARESLGKLSALDAEVRDDYWALIGELSNTLCQQNRFGEATAMLDEQGRWLKTHGGSGTDKVRLDALRGAVLGRSGKATGARRRRWVRRGVCRRANGTGAAARRAQGHKLETDEQVVTRFETVGYVIHDRQ